MKIAIVGYGKMGRLVERAAEGAGHAIHARIDAGDALALAAGADAAIEFTEPRAAVANIVRLAELGVPVLGAPEEFMQGPDYFFDLVYHLNDDGAAIATRRMLDHLRPHLVAAPR